MPRVSREQAELHRQAIEVASSHLLRERGLAVSVADVMGAAGLTHGGFYGHFSSKDDLVAIGCSRAFAQSLHRWERRMAERPDGMSPLTALVHGYLSENSRALPGNSCPAAALVNDVAREPRDKPVRAAYADGLVALLGLLEAADADRGEEDAACARLATMVGALVLARATAGRPLSDRFLEAARVHLTAGDRPRRKRRKKKADRSKTH